MTEVDWITTWEPVSHGPFFVTCEFLDGSERWTEVSAWIEEGWEITAPGNATVKPFKVVAWAELPPPFNG